MYDNEDEVKRKRRNLFIIIGVIILILLFIVILFFSSKGSKKKVVTKKMECELEVKDVEPNDDGVYERDIEIVFASITPASEDIKITSKKIGIREEAKNKETYKITKKGNYRVYGFVQDANGNKATCEISVEVEPSVPTCELEVIEGTLGNNDWYVTDVTVGFKSKLTNNDKTTIQKYFIQKELKEMETDRVIRAENPTEDNQTYTVKDNLKTELVGYVIDSQGNEGECRLIVKKDNDKPKCALKVVSGNKNGAGIYTTDVVVAVDSFEDATSKVEGIGIGTKKNYEEDSYVVTGPGVTRVTGYVKDEAGNEGTCSINIERPAATGGGNTGGGSSSGGGGSTPPPTPPPTTSYPYCELQIIGESSGGTYTGTVTVKFKSKGSTNGASVNSFGIGTSANFNGQESFTISSSGSHKVIGQVKDTNGKTATCSVNVTVQAQDNSLAKKVSVGDKIAYDAGKWTEGNGTVNETNGVFSGYTANNSKSIGVKCRGSADTSTRNGWIVLSKTATTVTIIHAGTPECYYHGRTSASTAVNNLNNRAQTYMNGFAQSARAMTKADYDVNPASHHVGTHYYLATVKSSETLHMIAVDRETGGSARAAGFRPVIVLKSNVKTTTKNGNGEWVLSQ